MPPRPEESNVEETALSTTGSGRREKVLSHRLRGFSDYDHSRSALEEALRSEAAYLEVDVRTTADGAAYLYHDSTTGSDVNERHVFATSSRARIEGLRFGNGEPLLTLEGALERFACRPHHEQVLAIDIKDFGFEELFLRTVRAANLEDRVCFVSWIPQTLLRLHELGCGAPLVLSHWNLTSAGPVGALMSKLLGRARWRFSRYVVLGSGRATTDLGNLAHGFQHALVCQRLPARIAEVLRSSAGGICVHRRLCGRSLAEYCAAERLELWTFSVGTPSEFLEYADRPGVDVVFCDDAPSVLDMLTHSPDDREAT